MQYSHSGFAKSPIPCLDEIHNKPLDQYNTLEKVNNLEDIRSQGYYLCGACV